MAQHQHHRRDPQPNALDSADPCIQISLSTTAYADAGKAASPTVPGHSTARRAVHNLNRSITASQLVDQATTLAMCGNIEQSRPAAHDRDDSAREPGGRSSQPVMTYRTCVLASPVPRVAGCTEGTVSMSAADAEQFARIAVELHEQAGLPETVDLVMQYALSAVGADAVSVMLLHRGGREIEIAGATNEVAGQADRLQLETGGARAWTLPVLMERVQRSLLKNRGRRRRAGRGPRWRRRGRRGRIRTSARRCVRVRSCTGSTRP